MERNWDNDMPRLKQLMPKIVYEYPRPWSIGIYPEGTRQTPSKLLEAQTFARSRGYVVLDNLLQPRVKGFRYLLHELKASLTYVIDVTTYYSPRPPSSIRFLLTGRLQDSTCLYVRVYKVEDIPTSEEELEQWLRDRWTEKDKIIEEMKANKIPFEIMIRDPAISSGYYAVFCVIFAIFLRMIGLNTFITVCWLVGALFPILIVMVERDDVEIEDKQEKLRRLSDIGIAPQHLQAILQKGEQIKVPCVSMEYLPSENPSQLFYDQQWWQNLKTNLEDSVATISRPKTLNEEGFDIVSDHEENS